MLQHIDSALESFLRTSIGLDARDVDVAFDPPDREWGGSLNRPTLNLFLWSINRNTDRDLAGQRATQVDGRTVYANAPVPIELRYLVTAWSADHEDESSFWGRRSQQSYLTERSAPTTIPGSLMAFQRLNLRSAARERSNKPIFGMHSTGS